MKHTLFVFSLLISSCLLSQRYIVQVKSSDTKLWGYANEKGEILIQPQYKQCFPFSSNGLAPIYDAKTKQHNFINLKGEILNVEKPGFILMNAFGFGLKSFSDGLVLVSYNKKWGYMDESGKLVIEAKYDKATSFSNGYATAQRGKEFFIIDKTGKEISLNDLGISGIKDFSEGLSPFTTAEKLTGFFDTEGKVAIEPTFKSVGYFSGGLAWAKNEAGKAGYIDKKGKWVIEPQFDVVKDFCPTSKLARVKQGDKWGYIRMDGKVVYPDNISTCGDFSNGLAYGKTAEGKVGFINEKGQWSIDAKFDAVGDFSNGYAAAKLDGKWGIIDTKGNWVCQPQYDAIKEVQKVN